MSVVNFQFGVENNMLFVVNDSWLHLTVVNSRPKLEHNSSGDASLRVQGSKVDASLSHACCHLEQFYI